MGLTKLTLMVDEDIVRKARAYARRRHTSIPRLVSAFLDGLAEPDLSAYPPAIQRWMGSLPEDSDETDYGRFLEDKYGP